MTEAAVADASPLILLSRAGYLDLLQLETSTTSIPGAVWAEIGAYGENDITARALRETAWLVRVEVTSVLEELIRWDLGRGETEALSWAWSHPGYTAVVDDLQARRCAAALGIPVRGTLGLVLLAKRRGRLASARVALHRLVERRTA